LRNFLVFDCFGVFPWLVLSVHLPPAESAASATISFPTMHGALMSIRRWINSLRPFLLGQHLRGPKWMPLRNRCRPVIERLEDRLPPAAGLASSNQQLLSAYGQLPLSFEANQGQSAAQVQYFTHTNGGTLFLTSNSAVLTLQSNNSPIDKTNLAAFDSPLSTQRTAVSSTGVALSLNLVGANPNASVVGLDKLPGISNYFIGNDPSRWHTNIPNYSKVEYQNVYPGINLVYYGNQQQLEYDYQLAPGADPSSIRFAVQGADSLSIDAKDNLILHTAIGDVLEHAPVIYQQVAGKQQPVTGQFVLLGNNEVGFQVRPYDANLPLTIDPVLSYSTYLGGHSYDYGYGVAVDGSGNAYVAGWTESTNFPTTSGAFQTSNASAYGYSNGFVTKLNASGTGVVYSTYLGGSYSGGCFAIAVDNSGNAYVTGATAYNFPTTSGAFQTGFGGGGSAPDTDAFVTKLNASGTALVYSTYLGANANDDGYGIAVDGSGNAYITGGTSSSNFPTTSGAFQTIFGGSGQNNIDSFVTKLNAGGSDLIYSTYLGGSSADYSNGIALDGSGNAYVTGFTASTDFPTTSGAFQTVSGGYDAFVTKLNADGTALVYSTYLGGIGFYNRGYGIALDSSGNAYVTGGTSTTTFPTTSGAFQTVIGGSGQSDAFVTKLNASGTALIYSTYLGGNNGDVGYGIAVDGSGNAYVTGITNSTNFPTTSGAFQTIFGGTADAFVTKLNATGSALAYSTYLGGNANDYGNGIAVDASGNAYVTGYTLSNNFPTTSGAFQTVFGGGSYPDAFVTMLNFPATATVTVSSSSPTSTYGEAVSFTATVAANGGGPTPSGTVLFFIDGSTTSFDGETLNNGSATSAFISILSVGLHTVTVTYNGDSDYPASTGSLIGGQTVTATPTNTALTDNGPNPSTYGDAVGFTATVSGGSGTDGETVFIEDADAANAVVASPTLSGGTVTFAISDLSGGTHDLFAVYNGNSTNAASNSSATPVTQVVNTPPQFVSIEVNGGTVQYHDAFGNGLSEPIAGQNSVVEQILVTFNEPVTLAPGAFSVVPYSISTDGLAHSGQVLVNSGPNPNQIAPILNAPIQVGDGHQWIITFGNNAATTPNGSGFYVLKDGVYSLNINHLLVTAGSQTLTADVGGPGASSFWALYGDTTFHDISGVDHPGYIGDTYSDASVGAPDFTAFKHTFNSDSTNDYAPPNYKVKFDANLDGSVAASDFVRFKANYNTDWQF
jgi:Bacterial Ig-like domain (group 3)/Beta-propeller repeat